MRDATPHSSANGFLRLPQVLALIPVSKATWYAGIKNGRYPAPTKLGPRTSAWRAQVIADLMECLSGAGDTSAQATELPAQTDNLAGRIRAKFRGAGWEEAK